MQDLIKRGLESDPSPACADDSVFCFLVTSLCHTHPNVCAKTTHAMVIDPLTLARFGQPPAGIDLSEVYMRSASALVITLSLVAVAATMMRFGARYLQHADLEADDYVSILALVRSCMAPRPAYYGQLVLASLPHDLALNKFRFPIDLCDSYLCHGCEM